MPLILVDFDEKTRMFVAGSSAIEISEQDYPKGVKVTSFPSLTVRPWSSLSLFEKAKVYGRCFLRRLRGR